MLRHPRTTTSLKSGPEQKSRREGDAPVGQEWGPWKEGVQQALCARGHAAVGRASVRGGTKDRPGTSLLPPLIASWGLLWTNLRKDRGPACIGKGPGCGRWRPGFRAGGILDLGVF